MNNSAADLRSPLGLFPGQLAPRLYDRVLLDPKGCTRIRVEYASATAQQIDAEATKRILCSRLMEFYAVPLSDARPEHDGGALSWNLGDLMIRPGEVI